jgi:hypothetical protein
LYAQWIKLINVNTGEYPDGLVTFSSSVFTIEKDSPYYVVVGNTGTGSASNGNRVTVKSGVKATVTLQNALIDVSSTNDACAFDVSGAKIKLVLEGSNTLKSGNERAGLHVPTGTQIEITSISGKGSPDGILAANGGIRGAGIGGNAQERGGTINIYGGDITALGMGSGNRGGGAGIGGGGGDYTGAKDGEGGIVTIDGGKIVATGGSAVSDGGAGAGIGGGGSGWWSKGGNGGTVTIISGSVIATGGNGQNERGGGAGIGGGGGWSRSSAATYTGPGDSENTTGEMWEGWNNLHTAYVKATAGSGYVTEKAQAIGMGAFH